MAEESEVKSCLMWETERPYHSRPRKSSYFRMFGEEWYLKLLLEDNANIKYYDCKIRLISRCDKRTLKSKISSSVYVIMSNQVIKCCDKRTIKQSEDLMLNVCPSKQILPISEDSCTWTVFCRLSCAEPLSLHMKNETVHLSKVKEDNPAPVCVDKSVQATTEIPRDIESLSSDYSTLFRDEIFPDFELKCGDRTFPVHRGVLSARSEVFRAMFRNKMLESEKGSADILDLEVPVPDLLLQFIYSGQLEYVTEDNITQLYEAADKYAVHSLKKACSHWMERNMTEENCVSFLVAADCHSDRDLAAAMTSFLVKHPRVMKTEAWMTFSKQHKDLANEVLQMFVSSIVD